MSDFIIKIAANATSGTGTFTLTPTDDNAFEGSETIGVAGTSLSTTVTGTTVTLTDNDSAAVTVNDANAAEGDSLTFTVTLNNAVQGGLTVTPGSFTNGTAANGDYEKKANPQTLSFTGTANETHRLQGSQYRGRGAGGQRDLHGGHVCLQCAFWGYGDGHGHGHDQQRR